MVDVRNNDIRMTRGDTAILNLAISERRAERSRRH